jgi:ATP-dependent Lhr-like helicase
MVYESRVGDVFVLGASSWRIEDITPDRVLVTPAPGQPGQAAVLARRHPGTARRARPGDRGGLPRAGAATEPDAARRCEQAGLDELAARNLIRYLADQRAATGYVPDDRTLVVERFRDELGDWRVVLHSPYGDRVHAPWALAIAARLRERYGGMDVQALHTDDGIIIRVPDSDEPPPSRDRAARPGRDRRPHHRRGRRERAVRVPVPRVRQPGAAAAAPPAGPPDAAVAAAAALRAAARDRRRYPAFPIVLETVRECLRDVFDVPALTELLRDIAARRIGWWRWRRLPRARSGEILLFRYVGAFMYEGDAPLAERRAQALSLDPALLAELLGQDGLRELLDPAVVAETERDLQHLSEARRCRDVEASPTCCARPGR